MENHHQIFDIDINWNLKIDSPVYYEFESFPNCSILNPLYYQNSIPNVQKGFYKIKPPLQFKNDIYISTNFLVVKSDFELSAIKKFEELSEFLKRFLKQLRIVSKQATINPNNAASHATDSRITNLAIVEKMNTIDKMVGKAYYINSKVKFSHLEIADQNLLNNVKPQVSHEILIDSIGGFYEGDYRKSILYSCMAAESLLAEEFDTKYNDIISANQKNRIYRISEIMTSKGLIKKDPIYKYLTANYKFKNLLHEIPLYLIGQSILLSMPDLYDEALVLYSTRNKIVHKGEPSEESKQTLNLDMEGAIKAFSVAINIFNWMQRKEFNDVLLNNKIEMNSDS